MSKDGVQLPCPLEELGCDTTSFDSYAYTWEAPDICVLAIHRKEDYNMIRQRINNYYLVSGRNNTSQYLFEVELKPKVFCNKPVQVYPTKYDSLYVVIDFGGLDVASGKRMGFSGEKQHLQYCQPSVSSDGRLFVHKPESPHTDNPNPETPLYINPDYVLHQRTKLDYLILESSKVLEGSEKQLLKNLCEQEHNQSLTILMLSIENPPLAGYMLNGNRSMLLSTDDSLAWLYHCPLMRSPPHVMNQCYDKIPIFYKNAIFLADPINQQTYPAAQVQNCSDRIKILFQFDIWKMRNFGSLLHPLENRGNDQQYSDQKIWVLYPEELLVVQEMRESTHEHSYLNSGTISLSALLQGKFYKSSLENSLSPTQQFVDQNSTLITPLQRSLMWTIWFPETTSKIIFWTHLDQLPMFWSFVEYFSLASCLSSSSLIS